MTNKTDNLIWIDLEMTGLDPKAHKIIEIATIITDSNLKILATGPVLAIHQSEDELAKMDRWNVEHHTSSGLVERVRSSNIDEAQAQAETLTFLEQWANKGKSPMCGNSICQDRRFLVETMPELATFFHYRNLDVSTLKILCQRWQPNIAAQYKKISTHQALEDIKDSINELTFYRDEWIQ